MAEARNDVYSTAFIRKTIEEANGVTIRNSEI